MPNGGRINYQIGFTVDKTGLDQLQHSLAIITNMGNNISSKSSLAKDYKEAGAAAKQLGDILAQTFNKDLGTLNVTKFNSKLKEAGLTISGVQSQLAKVGVEGQIAGTKLSNAILGANVQLKNSNKMLDDLAHTFTQTARWTAVNAVINKVVQSVSSAVTYVEKLDKSLNDIRIVTDKSAESMAEFSVKANEAAKNLGKATTDYTEASLIYYQQGLNDQEVEARANVTLKAANVTGQSTDEVSEQLTAVWNGYKVSAEEAELYVDKLAAVAATTASDLEELSTGMSKVASAANAMGVDVDQLNAQLATIVSVTRQAPESVGTALKTVYGRMGTISAGGVDEEDGATLTSYTEKMNKFGINVLDVNGKLRDMGSVMEEVGEKWKSFSREQQVSLAQAMAGIRQYNNLVALFENWDMYTEALKTSNNALGTLQKQQDIYMQSTTAKLKTLKATWEDLYSGLIDKDELDTGIDALTNLVQVFDNFIDSFGGGLKSIAAFGTIVAGIFNKQIAGAIINAKTQLDSATQNKKLLEIKEVEINKALDNPSNGNNPQLLAAQANNKAQAEMARELQNVYKGLTEEQANQYIELQRNTGALEEEIVLSEQLLINRAKANEEKRTEIELSLKDISLAQQKFEEVEGELLNKKQLLELTKKTNEELLAEAESAELIELLGKDRLGLETKIQEKIIATLRDFENEEAAGSRLLKILKENKIVDDKIIKDLKEELALRREILDTANNNAEKRAEQSYNKAIGKEIINQGKQSFDIKETIHDITTFASSAAMAWGSIGSLIQTIKDDSSSTADIIVQSLMTIGFAVPSVISVFSSLGGIIGKTANIFKYLNATQTISTAINKKNGVSVYNLSNEEMKELAVKIGLVSANENYNRSELAVMLTEALRKGSLKSLITALKEKIAKTWEAVAANLGLKASELGIVSIIIGLVIGAVIACVKAYENYKKEIKQTAEELQKSADKHKEITEELTEEKNKINELKDAYNDLQNQYKESKISTEELKNKTYELCSQYGDQELALLALVGAYDKVEEKIKNLDYTKNKEIFDSSKEDVEKYKKSIEAGIESQSLNNDKHGNRRDILDITYNDKAQEYIDKYKTKKIYNKDTGYQYEIDTIDLEDMWARQDKRLNDFQKELESLGIEFVNNDHIITESFKNTIINNREKLEKVLMEYADTEPGIQLADYLEELKPQLDALKEVTDLRNENALSVSFYNNFNKDNIKNLQDYLNLINKIKNSEELEGIDLNNKEIEEFVKNAISEFDDLADYAKTLEISEFLLGPNAEANERDYKDSLNKLAKMIEDFNDSEKSFIILHPVLAKEKYKKGELENFVKENQSIVDYEENKVQTENANNLLKSYIDNGKFTDEDRNFAKEELGIDNAKIVTEEELLSELKDFYNKALEETNSYYQSAYNQAVQLQTEIANQGEIKDNFTGKNLNNIKDTDYAKTINDKMEELGAEGAQAYKTAFEQEFSADSVLSLIDSINADQEENGFYSEDSKKKIQELSNIFGKDFIPSLSKSRKELNNYNKKVKETQELVESVSEIQKDWQTEIKTSEIKFDNLNKALDDLQSAYKALQNAEEEYNEQGFITADTYQSLLSLAPEYLTKICDETGAIKLNKDSFIELTKAKYDEIAASKIQILLDQLAAAAASEEAMAKLEQTYATNFLTSASEDAAEALAKLTLAEIENSNASVTAKQNMINYVNSILSLKEAAVKGLNSKNFDVAIGAKSSKSSSSSKKDKEEKKYADEFDRYHDINKAIDNINHSLDIMDELQEHLHGKELANSLKQENALLQQQKAQYEALAAEQRKEAGELQSMLAGYGLAFDASGAIANYAQATAAMLEEFNQAVRDYNRGLISETEYSAAEKRYEDFKKQLERYETLYYDEMRETEDKLREIHNKEIENNLKAWQAEIEFHLDLSEAEREWNQFLKEINTNFKLTFKDIGKEFENILDTFNSYGKSGGDFDLIIGAMSDIESEINKMMGGGESNKFRSVSEAQEYLKDYMNKLQDAGEELFNLYQEAWDAYLEGIDQAADKLDDLMDKFKRIDEELEFQGELIELLYGPEAYGLMTKLYEGQRLNSLEQIKSLQQQVNLWSYELSQVEEGTEDWQKFYDLMNEAQAELNDSVIDYIQLLKDDYTNTVNSVIKNLEKSLTGSSLDDLATEWERIKEKSDKYYDSIEGLYEIQKLANEINESIDNTNDLKAKEKLQKLYDREINYLREKENLTEYDIQQAEARYQIALKEIALEESQNNKTSMKLTRGGDGNWSYQYVADEGDVEDKQQELLDAYQKAYDLAKNAYQDNLESLQDLHQRYLDSLKEIYLDETLSEEEKQIKINELRTWYEEQYNLLADENQLYRNDLAIAGAALLLELYNEDLTNYTAMTEEEQNLVDILRDNYIQDFMDIEDAINDNFDNIKIKSEEVMSKTLEEWSSGAQRIADAWNVDDGTSVKSQVTKAIEEINQKTIEYSKLVDEVAAIVGRDFSETGITGAINKAENATNQLRNATQILCNEAINELAQYRNNLKAVEQAWEELKQRMISAMNEALRYLQMVGQQAVNTANQIKAALAAANSAQPPSYSGKSSGGGGGNTTWTVSGVDKYGHPATTTVTANTLAEAKEKIHNTLEKSGEWRQVFNTGGYTGEWTNGSQENNGKLAFLHQKELVLNADDTENILSVVDIVRQMTNGITGGISGLIGSISSGIKGNISNNNSNSENNVFNITAEFPNANDVNEIREAILSLPNLASQYMSRPI